MSESLFSPSWYRVRNLTPRLRAHARIHRHRYRGEIWYVLHDPASDGFLRFTPSAHYLIGIMDGRRSVEEIWQLAAEELGDDAPTQDETIQLLAQLHASDVLQCDVPPDVLELFERSQRRQRQQLRARLLSPFAIRIHLLDPERFLEATLAWVRPLFGWLGALLWLVVVVPALVQAVTHWPELSEDVLDHLFAPANLLLIWLLFPLLKLFHEFGHGYAAKAFGGEVHDMGIMFLVFTPVPYVDASSSWALPSKGRRALVAAAGMIVEVFLASVALHVWLAAEPGALRAIAYNAVLIGGVTTLLFNANPLLRFDGYYILSDLLEIPNLASRANRYLGYLVERHAFGLARTESPATASSEPPWLVGYAISSFLYRVTVIVAITLWILDQYLLAGILLGGFAAMGWLGIPLFRALKSLLVGPRLRPVRRRALVTCAAALALVGGVLALVPIPLHTQAEGVLWVPEDGLVRAGSEGFVERIAASPGQTVAAGDLLVELRDPDLEAELQTLQGRVRELRARRDAERTRSRVGERLTLEQLHYAEQSLARVRERAADLSVRSRVAGSVVMPRSDELPGRFVRQGDLLGFVLDRRSVTVRAVVDQGDVDLVRQRTEAVELRLAERLGRVHRATLRRVVPAASERLPSVALGMAGGGDVPVDPSRPEGDLAVESVFEVELSLDIDAPVHYGGRVYVRFDHGREPLAAQWYRRLRQVFLSRFHV